MAKHPRKGKTPKLSGRQKRRLLKAQRLRNADRNFERINRHTRWWYW